MATLPTSGRVVVQTTVGDIEIELWARETPLACRNFITLALEGYYDGVIFHRIVPNFLIQTGDRTGTGNGGESLYGEPFDDETHPRLRFSHRGLVGMANNGDKNSNTSQFFITLSKAEELQGKHTLFGRVVGDTIYNVMKIGDLELDENERPLYPPKIRQIKILEDPFGDIIPRITAAEKRAQQLAKEQAQKERLEAGKRKQGKKDAKLLSFGDEEEDGGEAVSFKKKAIVRTDLVDVAPEKPSTSSRPARSEKIPPPAPLPTTSSDVPIPKATEQPVPQKKSKKAEPQTESERRKAEVAKVEEELRKLTRQRDSDSDDGKPAKKAKKGPSIIELQNAKYQRGKAAAARRAGKKRDESDVIAALQNFRGKLQRTKGDSGDEEDAKMEGVDPEGADKAQPDDAEGGEEGIEVDDDVDWLRHRLHFADDGGAETLRAEHEYEVIDPRMRGAKAKEEEMERKRARKEAHGGRGYRAPPPGPRR